MFNVAEHNCGDCKLKCIDCNAQICPKCMVQCPVGNRCKSCTKRFTSHVLQIDFWIIFRCFITATVVGFLFAIAQRFLLSAGFFMLILIYFLGTLAGNLIFRISGRKIGSKIATTVAAGVFIGSLAVSFCEQSIYSLVLNEMVAQSQSAQSIPGQDQAKTSLEINRPKDMDSLRSNDSELADETDIAENTIDNQVATLAKARQHIIAPPISLALIIFILGTISPFLGWSSPFANLFRR